MKIILDTNIYFSAFAFDKKVLELLDLCYKNHNVYLSTQILVEIKEKLFSNKMKKAYKGYLEENANTFFKKIKSESIFIYPTSKISICRDPDDNKFLELAKETQADYLISGDADLLELKHFESTQILKPSEFLSLEN